MRMTQINKKDTTELSRLQKAMEEMWNAWYEADRNEIARTILSEFHTEINITPPALLPKKYRRYNQKQRPIPLDLSKNALQILEIQFRLKEYLDAKRQGIKVSGTKSIKGKNIADPYLIYIRKLLDILKKSGIKITKSKPTANTNQLLKADRFLERLNKELPENLKHPVKSWDAWAQDRYRALS
jgi:hypothetical protein